MSVNKTLSSGVNFINMLYLCQKEALKKNQGKSLQEKQRGSWSQISLCSQTHKFAQVARKVSKVKAIKALCEKYVTSFIYALKVYKINLKDLYCDLTLIFILWLKCHGACK